MKAVLGAAFFRTLSQAISMRNMRIFSCLCCACCV
nr:MAG TPA: hypothetical protein [Caudoviricetes sp.]